MRASSFWPRVFWQWCHGLRPPSPADHQKVVRLPLPDGNDFPISSAVTVKAGVDTYFLSGALAPVINKDAPKGSVAAYGDTETQTVGALNAIKGDAGAPRPDVWAMW